LFSAGKRFIPRDGGSKFDELAYFSNPETVPNKKIEN
jgi:hypothetical protein